MSIVKVVIIRNLSIELRHWNAFLPLHLYLLFSGNSEPVWVCRDLESPTGVSTDFTGLIYVASFSGKKIYVLSHDGKQGHIGFCIFFNILFLLRLGKVCLLGSSRGAMGRAWVFQTRCPVSDSRRITVVSGRASDLKCSCATLVQIRRPVLILKIKKRVTSRFLTEVSRL